MCKAVRQSLLCHISSFSFTPEYVCSCGRLTLSSHEADRNSNFGEHRESRDYVCGFYIVRLDVSSRRLHPPTTIECDKVLLRKKRKNRRAIAQHPTPLIVGEIRKEMLTSNHYCPISSAREVCANHSRRAIAKDKHSHPKIR